MNPARRASSKQCSTSNNHHLRLALKLFRRTSYLQVRLEFLRYPQFIRSLFNVSRFGPPFSVTNFNLNRRVDHLVSGLRPNTIRPIQTRFRYGSIFCLTLHQIVTRRFILQKARHHPLTALTTCKHTVSSSFTPFRVLFTFPSRYWFTIGH